MKLFKTVLLSVVLSLFVMGAVAAQTPELPDASKKLRAWVGGGYVTGSERDFNISDESFVAAGGMYFPSSILPSDQFYSFVGFIYNRAEPENLNTSLTGDTEVRTMEFQYRVLYYFTFSDIKKGVYATLGPDYQHVANPDPLAFSGSILKGATGLGAYYAPGAGNSRINFTIEKDFVGDLAYREWRFILGYSFPFDLKS